MYVRDIKLKQYDLYLPNYWGSFYGFLLFCFRFAPTIEHTRDGGSVQKVQCGSGNRVRFGVAVGPTHSSTTSYVCLLISMLVVTSSRDHGNSRVRFNILFLLVVPINWDHHPMVLQLRILQ
jgi:hypothetical protein